MGKIKFGSSSDNVKKDNAQQKEVIEIIKEVPVEKIIEVEKIVEKEVPIEKIVEVQVSNNIDEKAIYGHIDIQIGRMKDDFEILKKQVILRDKVEVSNLENKIADNSRMSKEVIMQLKKENKRLMLVCGVLIVLTLITIVL